MLRIVAEELRALEADFWIVRLEDNAVELDF